MTTTTTRKPMMTTYTETLLDTLDTLRHAYRHVNTIAERLADGCAIAISDDDALGILDECMRAVEERRHVNINWL